MLGSATARRRGDRVRGYLLRCICPLMALSGLTETDRYLSAIGGRADMLRTSRAHRCNAIAPKRTNVIMTFSQCGVFGATKKALAFSSPAGAFSALP